MTPQLNKKEEIIAKCKELQEALIENLEAEMLIESATTAKSKSQKRLQLAKESLR